ncbi:hypothetical protein QZH41_019023 [Actinostola sp. cb2023]|nr:hypothetical protein QZH41_019023 [Actinostola sp. cb2023]
MAALSVKEAIENIFESDDEHEHEEEEVEDLEEGKDEDLLDSWLDTFPAQEGFNRDLFKDIASELLKPVVKQCSVSCGHGELQPTERSKAATLLSFSSVNAASVIHSEASLWMRKIYTRLSGRVAVRRPYHAKICRQIPHEIFKVARRVVVGNKDGSFFEPRCYVRTNSKAEVICFTSLYSFQKFMSTISGLSRSEMKKYFSRQLQGRNRLGHTVKLLVDDEKQISFTYWIKRGQLDIAFQYGEWNTRNYPQHNCDFDPEEL